MAFSVEGTARWPGAGIRQRNKVSKSAKGFAANKSRFGLSSLQLFATHYVHR